MFRLEKTWDYLVIMQGGEGLKISTKKERYGSMITKMVVSVVLEFEIYSSWCTHDLS